MIWIKGAGDLATGVAYRLHRAGFAVAMSELPEPVCVRRHVAFAEAVVTGIHTVEGVTAVRAATAAEVARAHQSGQIPVLVDPTGRLCRELKPGAVVDAIMAKRNTGTGLTDAPVVIAIGPGFTVGVDCHAVVETQRGHFLGRALYAGTAAPDTGEPGELGGVRGARVVRAPVAGRFCGSVAIGARVQTGQTLGQIRPAGDGPVVSVTAGVGGVLRGLIRTGVQVAAGLKIGDVDPTGEVERCSTISDKALAVAGGVIEALLALRRSQKQL